ncbi:MAG TPA: single-stranded DNA-binding protein, partial [Streptosporangiaceae bacterium]|nr:single-stranded DNA-binding protein [Streptosporangiaceae bacterium]
ARVTDLRIGATPRIQDRVTGQWRDAETSYYDVSCWRRLGDHVRASLRKGDPVMIKGRFRTSGYTDKNGVYRTSINIEADTVGHDLNRGIANFMRPESRPAVTEDDRALEPVPDLPEDDDLPEDHDMIEDRDLAEDRDMIDAQAIEQFGHALDSLGEAGLADQALDEDEAADTTVPSGSPTSY